MYSLSVLSKSSLKPWALGDDAEMAQGVQEE
jgi:hypothetical protein